MLWAQDGAQSAAKPGMMAPGANPDWVVATVKRSDPNDPNDTFDFRGRQVIFENQTVEAMLLLAYGIQKSQIAGAPEWVRTERWDVNGLLDMDGKPSLQQFRSVVEKMLEKRFGLKAHKEQREMQVFALTVAKGGPKLTLNTSDPNGLRRQQVRVADGERREEFTNTSMKELAVLMLVEVDRPVVDQTGLQGRYDFKLSFTNDESDAPTDGSVPPGLFTAIQEQLGLKLAPAKAPVDVLVIDHVEKPSEN
jgi:uncharacterized protein (TIGR03435 family)